MTSTGLSVCFSLAYFTFFLHAYVHKSLNFLSISTICIPFQIDCSVLLLMDDQDLKPYLPNYGDRLALFAYARRHTGEQDNEGPKTASEIKKRSLLSRLKDKLERNSKSEQGVRSEKARGNKNAKKEIRRIEIGWLDFEIASGIYKQVRSMKGGGTRHLQLPVCSTVQEVMEQAQELFFPKGVSQKGSLHDYTVKMVDFGRSDVDAKSTIGEIYADTKVKILRLYLASKSILAPDSEDDNTMMCWGENSKQIKKDQEHDQKLITSMEADQPVVPPLVPDQVASIVNPTNFLESIRDNTSTPTKESGDLHVILDGTDVFEEKAQILMTSTPTEPTDKQHVYKGQSPLTLRINAKPFEPSLSYVCLDNVQTSTTSTAPEKLESQPESLLRDQSSSIPKPIGDLHVVYASDSDTQHYFSDLHVDLTDQQPVSETYQ